MPSRLGGARLRHRAPARREIGACPKRRTTAAGGFKPRASALRAREFTFKAPLTFLARIGRAPSGARCPYAPRLHRSGGSRPGRLAGAELHCAAPTLQRRVVVGPRALRPPRPHAPCSSRMRYSPTSAPLRSDVAPREARLRPRCDRGLALLAVERAETGIVVTPSPRSGRSAPLLPGAPERTLPPEPRRPTLDPDAYADVPAVLGDRRSRRRRTSGAVAHPCAAVRAVLPGPLVRRASMLRLDPPEPHSAPHPRQQGLHPRAVERKPRPSRITSPRTSRPPRGPPHDGLSRLAAPLP